jgi:hypothetical protein
LLVDLPEGFDAWMNLAFANQLKHLQSDIMALDRPHTPSKILPSQPVSRRTSGVGGVVDFYFKHWSSVLLSLEFLLNIYFLHHGPLHPIDYPTYLVQARQIRLGERDYAKIAGPTGPLVYPGGHVFIFTIFERAFGIKGDSDWNGYIPAQLIFLGLQLVHTYVCSSQLWLLID